MRILVFFLVIYLIYRGINFLFKIFAAMNTANTTRTNTNKDNVSPSPKSKFKDIEEAKYTEIKEDKKKEDPQ